jgi:hypothetical protein
MHENKFYNLYNPVITKKMTLQNAADAAGDITTNPAL